MTSININDPRRDTRDQVLRLYGMGWAVRRIAKSLDISTQRVYKILADTDTDQKETA